jgi:hypothetical protein
MRILQLNVNRSPAAHDLLQALAVSHGADFLLTSEPNRRTIATSWIADGPGDCAIYNFSKSRAVVNVSSGSGWVSVELSNMMLISTYVSPNVEPQVFSRFLGELEIFVRSTLKEVIICGDLNAKSPRWGCRYEDARGIELMEFVDGLGLQCLNVGDTPTFERGLSSSVLDVSFATDGLAGQIEKWEVLDEEVLSDHRCILITLHDAIQQQPTRSFFKRTNMRRLKEAIGHQLHEEEELSAAGLTELLSSITRALLQHPGTNRRAPMYWWTPEIAALRQDCQRQRRTLQRLRARGMEEEGLTLLDGYRLAKKKLRWAIKDSKRAKWMELCDEADNNLWGTAYKIVSHRWGRRLPVVSRAITEATVTALFPHHSPPELEELAAPELIPFSINEMENAVARMGLGRSGGPDGTPPEAIVYAAQQFPQKILHAMNKALRDGEFPNLWKRAQLVLLDKGKGAPLTSPAAFRPLCLLNVVGKFFEQLLGARLREELEQKNILSERQYGFRKGRSTLDAMDHVMRLVDEATAGTWRTRKIPVVVTLDVQNAFNSASWGIILYRLREANISPYIRRIIQKYFDGRTLVASAEDSSISADITSGVPQGSVLGPILWNVLYDGVLRLPMEDGVTVIGYADDLALVVTAKTEADLMLRTNCAISQIRAWLEENHLSLAPDKTEAVVMAGRRRLAPITFRVNQTVVQPTDKIKYLGLWLDRRRTFVSHVAEVAAKAERTASALQRMMTNIHGPRQGKRRVLAAVVHSVMLYAAPVWGRVLNNKRAMRKLHSINRRMALRVCCAYRTVSATAVQVVAGVPPVDLLIRERMQRREGGSKEECRQTLLQVWNEQWIQGNGWTNRLITNLQSWLQRQHGEVNHWLAQFLTGHGIFAAYLKRIGKARGDSCWYCPLADSVEHTFFNCIRWMELRETCWRVVGHQTPDTIVETMLSGQIAWSAVDAMVTGILMTKRGDETRLAPMYNV